MAPEQLEGKEADSRTDIFAFGAVVYEMATGKKAFEGKSQASLIHAIMGVDPPSMSSVQPLSPPALDQIVKSCLAKDPDERWQTAGDLGRQLKWIIEAGSPATLAAQVAVAPPRSVWQRAVPLLVTAVLAAVLGGVAVWRLMSAGAPALQPVTRFTLAFPAGLGPQGIGIGRHVVAISPQGTHLVYWATDQLYLHAIDRLDEAIPIRGTEGAREPFFSPDGQQVGFWDSFGRQLKRVSVSGGAPVTLGDSMNPWGASWGADGMIRYGQGLEGIWQVPATGGTPAQLIGVKEGELVHGPQLLPGGEWVLLTIRSPEVGSWDQAQIVMQSLETGERIVLIEGGRDARYLPTGHLVYGLNAVLLAVPFDVGERRVTGGPVPLVEGVTGGPVPLVEGVMDADVRTGAMHFSVSAHGSLVYLLGTSGESRMLSWVDREGREEPLPVGPLPYAQPRISPDGTRVAVNIGSPNELDVHVYELARDVLTQLTSEPARGRFALWTPDSRRVVFYSDRDGGGLFLKAVDGTGTVDRLTTSAAAQVPYSWSADGRTLVFQQKSADPFGSEVYVLSLDGEPTTTPLLQAGEREPVVSPHGQWIAYTSRRDVYVRPFPNVEDGRWRISTDGGFSPLWSPDGRQLFFISSQAQAMVVPVETEPTFRPGTPKVMFELPPYYRSSRAGMDREWDIAPDGERFLLVNPGEVAATDAGATQPQMIVVLNWFEELKRLVPTDN
jgi:serine/threonine-protein kinase